MLGNQNLGFSAHPDHLKTLRAFSSDPARQAGAQFAYPEVENKPLETSIVTSVTRAWRSNSKDHPYAKKQLGYQHLFPRIPPVSPSHTSLSRYTLGQAECLLPE